MSPVMSSNPNQMVEHDMRAFKKSKNRPFGTNSGLFTDQKSKLPKLRKRGKNYVVDSIRTSAVKETTPKGP